MNNSERRQSKRIRYACEIQCEGTPIGRVETRINDISVTGLFIDSLAHLPVGSILHMRFTVRGTPIEVTGEVRYCMPKVGMGVQFLDLRPDYQDLLEELVEGKPLDTQPLVLPAEVAAALPVEEKENTAAEEESDPILMGNFAVINLFDVIQMIENSRITGALAIQATTTHGELHFNEGLIVNAKTNMGYGLDAVAQVLDLRQGRFEFRRTEREYLRHIEATSNTGLLLDLLAARDNEAAYQ